jgi:hypothetical protein
MSRIEPTVKRAAPTQKARISFRYSKYTTTAPTMHSETPAAVRAFGETRVRARPSIDREARRRTPPV